MDSPDKAASALTESAPHNQKPSRWSFLQAAKEFVDRKISRRNAPEPSTSKPMITPPVLTPEEETPPEKPTQTNIGTDLLASLVEKGILIDDGIPETGISILAEGTTNETVDEKLLEKIKSQEKPPNGYLIGVGAGNIFSMIKAFPEGNGPKAILLFDINPKVIAFCKQLIQGFKNSPDYGKQIFTGTSIPLHQKVLREKGELLHKLAKEGNFIIARTDMIDQRLIDELGKLPGIHEQSNLIYLSNIADPIYEIGQQADPNYLPSFDKLNALVPDPPYKNYFADTVRFSLNYNVRVRTQAPEFSSADFSDEFNRYGVGINDFRFRPLDEIERTVEKNPNFEDISGLNVDSLVNLYNSLRDDPAMLARATSITQQTSEWRQENLDRWDEFVRRSQEPPEKITDNLERRYIAPSPDLREELKKPYTYERDFIPYVAKTYWQKAVLPNQIKIADLPRVNPIKRDPKTNVKYVVADLADGKKGRIEEATISHGQGLRFEEMAMAKLYREAKNRLLSKNPNANVKRRTFDELISELKIK